MELLGAKIIGGRIRDARKQAGLTQSALADQLQTHQSIISDIEKGEKLPDITMAAKIADRFGWSLDALLTGQTGSTIAEHHATYLPNQMPPDHRRADVYSMAGAGAPHSLTEYEPITSVVVPERYLRAGIVPVLVRGRSMEPTIVDNAIVGVDTNDRNVVSGEVYGIWLPYEGAVIRRVYINFDTVTLQPDNSQFKPQTISVEKIEADTFLLGRVKWVIQEY
jgi:transcriptional regulator with XRE-family HTH domain